jgi:hypothetical protein
MLTVTQSSVKLYVGAYMTPKKYSLYINIETAPLIESASMKAITQYLMEETNFIKEGNSYYNREREGRWSEEDCLEFMQDNVEDIAHWAGYTIKELS